MSEFFYDQQIRRHIEQFIRLFSDINVHVGKDKNGVDIFQKVPARYGDASRMASHILRNNSENFMNAVPMISCYIEGIDISTSRRLNPTYQDKVQVYERQFNKETNQYEEGIGDTYTVERHMPVPYDLKFSVDVWTSNTDQKLQLFEQIGLMFNPAVNIMSSNNAFDWGAKTYVEVNSVNYSSKSIPQGADSVTDITSWKFTMPIWLTPPAKVKRQVLIYNIITEIKTVDSLDVPLKDVPLSDLPVNSTQFMVITYEDRKIEVEGNKISLLNNHSTTHDDENGGTLKWSTELLKFGQIKKGVSQLRLRRGDDVEIGDNDIIGLIEHDPEDDNKLIFTVDTTTLPRDTLPLVMGIIDPSKSMPSYGIIPPAAVGQRYLLVSDVLIGSGWGDCNGKTNDIIEFNGSEWVVSFDSRTGNINQFVTNANTMVKYHWTGTEWVDSYQGIYNPAYWRLYL
jgi:T4-like virus Myoviridae tail sheath stabiliser